MLRDLRRLTTVSPSRPGILFFSLMIVLVGLSALSSFNNGPFASHTMATDGQAAPSERVHFALIRAEELSEAGIVSVTETNGPNADRLLADMRAPGVDETVLRNARRSTHSASPKRRPSRRASGSPRAPSTRRGFRR